MKSPPLATTRLVGRAFDAVDLDGLLALFRDEEVRRYLLDGLEVGPEWVRGEIRSSDERFAAGSAGLWALRRTGEIDIVGFVGFRPFFDPPELQLLYGFLPSAWGDGLATEAGRGAIDFAIGTLGFAEVRAAVDIPNARSAAVLERLGMTLEKTTSDGPAGTAFYVLTAQDWRARNAAEGGSP